MSPFEIGLLLIFVPIAYVVGYWHGSRIGAAQSIRALVKIQYFKAPSRSSRLNKHLAAFNQASEGERISQQTVLNSEEAQIINLFLAGYNASGIVSSLYGMDITSGRTYMKRMSDVQTVIRADLARYRSNSTEIED